MLLNAYKNRLEVSERGLNLVEIGEEMFQLNTLKGLLSKIDKPKGKGELNDVPVHSWNFHIYEAFFRTFCINKFVEFDYHLRADSKSFAKGIKYWYGGQENPAMAYFIYEFLSKGQFNHVITFSEFLRFCRTFQLAKDHQNRVVYQMITEMNHFIRV